MMDKEEIAETFQEYLSEKGLWQNFADWLADKGIMLDELGFQPDLFEDED